MNVIAYQCEAMSARGIVVVCHMRKQVVSLPRRRPQICPYMLPNP